MNIQVLRRNVAARGMRFVTGHGSRPAALAEVLGTTGILRVLICRTSHSLGNTLLVTPLVQEIEAIWPGAEIDIVTRNPVATEIFASYSCVRNIYCLPRRGMRQPLNMLRQIGRIRQTHYDLAIDTDPRSQTGRALLLQSHARCKLGFVSDRKGGAVTHGVEPLAAPKHSGQIPVYLLRQALHRGAATYPSLDLRLSEIEREEGRQILARLVGQTAGSATKKGVIGIFANATGRKLLDREWWREFMPAIEQHYSDFSFVEIVPASGASMLDSRYPAYYSSSVRKLAKVLSGLSMVICLDCGIMHLARASGAPTAAIFTVTDAAEWGPYGDGAYVVRGEHQSAEQVAHRFIDEVPLDAFRIEQ